MNNTLTIHVFGNEEPNSMYIKYSDYEKLEQENGRLKKAIAEADDFYDCGGGDYNSLVRCPFCHRTWTKETEPEDRLHERDCPKITMI